MLFVGLLVHAYFVVLSFFRTKLS